MVRRGDIYGLVGRILGPGGGQIHQLQHLVHRLPAGYAPLEAVVLQVLPGGEELISSHILSELSSVATRYGFMEQGRLLEEISAEALHDKCRTCLRLEVDDAPKAPFCSMASRATPFWARA